MKNEFTPSCGVNTAARFLYRVAGFDILERNWTCAAGEVSIIARDGTDLVFVEVNYRSASDEGLPPDAVDAAKRTRYERIAASFLQGYDVADVKVRFDVVSLLEIAQDRAFLRHCTDAFAA